ncbi:Lsr2 family protein [Amycolatopsis sp. NPDC059021]|uniref:histone-like nucleoid-structuring protein Lsr2 n=1 Tax=Amycolatopsis sp. NPDC059021 TaxID=3346704 RepID=UPI00366ACA0A
MAQKVLVQMMDDIDGGEASQTVPFSLDGVQYEIDLSDDNAENLREGLAPFLAASRRVGGRKVRLAVGQSAAAATAAPAPVSQADRERSRAIRAWALDNGYEVSERGRIPREIVEAFERAEAEPEPVKAPRKRASRKKAGASA